MARNEKYGVVQRPLGVSLMFDICGNCGRSIRDAREVGTSGLYFPGGYDIDLCINCYWTEEMLIDETGTNSHPGRLVHYLEMLGHRTDAKRIEEEMKKSEGLFL